MQPHQYPQQPWTESSRPNIEVQTPQPARFQQPVAERQFSEPQRQQPQFQQATETTQAGHPGDLQFQGPSTQQPQQPQPQSAQSQFVQPQPVQPQSQLQSPQQFAPERVSQQRQPAAQLPQTQQPTGRLGGSAPVLWADEGQMAGKALMAGQAKTAGAAGTEQQMAGAGSAQTVTQPEQQAETAQLKRGVPSVDVHETPDEIVVYADVPGCTPDDVELLGNQNSITLVAKRVDPSLKNAKTIQRERVDEVERTIPLPVSADVEEAEATVEAGVCRITLPKDEEERKKRIGIQ